MKEKTKTILIILIIVLCFVLMFMASNYRHNKCVKIMKEELIECRQGDYLEEDCYQFKNAEEYCWDAQRG